MTQLINNETLDPADEPIEDKEDECVDKGDQVTEHDTVVDETKVSNETLAEEAVCRPLCASSATELCEQEDQREDKLSNESLNIETSNAVDGPVKGTVEQWVESVPLGVLDQTAEDAEIVIWDEAPAQEPVWRPLRGAPAAERCEQDDQQNNALRNQERVVAWESLFRALPRVNNAGAQGGGTSD
jgi:hypothetical protein